MRDPAIAAVPTAVATVSVAPAVAAAMLGRGCVVAAQHGGVAVAVPLMVGQNRLGTQRQQRPGGEHGDERDGDPCPDRRPADVLVQRLSNPA